MDLPSLLSAREQEAVLQQVIAYWQHQDRPASMAELTEQDVASLYSVIQGHFLLGSDSATTAEEVVQPRGVGKKARPDQGCGACGAPRCRRCPSCVHTSLHLAKMVGPAPCQVAVCSLH